MCGPSHHFPPPQPLAITQALIQDAQDVVKILCISTKLPGDAGTWTTL